MPETLKTSVDLHSSGVEIDLKDQYVKYQKPKVLPPSSLDVALLEPSANEIITTESIKLPSPKYIKKKRC